MSDEALTQEKHKYLDELNLCPDNIWFMDGGSLSNDSRIPVWRKEREEYGFDSRETWDLRSVFYIWLYERLRMYIDYASKIVNLNYYHFTYKDKEYTQREMIELILDRIRFFYSEEFDDLNEEHVNKTSEIEEVWAMIVHAMWW